MLTATHKGKYYDAEYSIVNISEVGRKLRIDAEYYNPEYIELEKKILKKGTRFFLLHPTIIHPTEIERVYVDDKNGIEMILAKNIRNNELDFSQKFIMSAEREKFLKKNELKKFDILMTRSGVNYGQTAPFLESKKMFASADCLIIRVNQINPLFLSTYFNTKQGKVLLKRLAYGLAQPHIAPSSLKLVAIPIPSNDFQNFIEKLILKAYEERQKAEQLYKQAEEVLLEELELKNWKPKTKKINIGGREFEEEENISIRMLCEVVKADRMDAEYWEPKYDEILTKIARKSALKSLREFLKRNIKRGIEVGSNNYQKKGIPFIRVSNISKLGIVENNQKYISKELYNKLKRFYKPKRGEILLTKDATPGIAYVLKNDIEGIISSGIVKLSVQNIEEEYLALVINSIVGRIQIKKEGGGSIISHWKPKQIEELLIPTLSSQIQRKISQLIQQSFKVRKNSKKLLKIAKETVETYIELNENAGMEFAKVELQKLNI